MYWRSHVFIFSQHQTKSAEQIVNFQKRIDHFEARNQCALRVFLEIAVEFENLPKTSSRYTAFFNRFAH